MNERFVEEVRSILNAQSVPFEQSRVLYAKGGSLFYASPETFGISVEDASKRTSKWLNKGFVVFDFLVRDFAFLFSGEQLYGKWHRHLPTRVRKALRKNDPYLSAPCVEFSKTRLAMSWFERVKATCSW